MTARRRWFLVALGCSLLAAPALAHDPIDRLRKGEYDGFLDDSLRTGWVMALISALGSGALAEALGRAGEEEEKRKRRCEKTPWWKTGLSILAGGVAAAAVVMSAPASLPALAIGAGATAAGVGFGLSVNKAITAREGGIDWGTLVWGFGQGFVITGAALAAMAAFPAALTGIALAGSTVGTYSMLQEHFGWDMLPWERGSKAYCEMTPDEQRRSLGGLTGGMLGGLTAGVVARFAIPRIAHMRAKLRVPPEKGPTLTPEAAAAVEADLVNRFGMPPDQAKLLVAEAMAKRGSDMVVGGSRVRGNAGPQSDIDVGFNRMTPNHAQKLVTKVNKLAENTPGGIPLEDNARIVHGNETPGTPKIHSAEEFFMRSGTRGPKDAKAGQRYGPSGYVHYETNGQVTVVPPPVNPPIAPVVIRPPTR